MAIVAVDNFKYFKPFLVVAGKSGFAVTPSDTDELPFVTNKLYVGGGGDIKVTLASDSTPITLKAVPTGAMLDLRIRQVWLTGTTATFLVGIQ